MPAVVVVRNSQELEAVMAVLVAVVTVEPIPARQTIVRLRLVLQIAAAVVELVDTTLQAAEVSAVLVVLVLSLLLIKLDK
jgi:hypothetical protein